ncbi:MAG: DUF559 domain-containing protein [Myxococcaceae bacterium]
MDPRTLDKQVLLLSQRQHGVFCLAQLLRLGATRSQARHRLRKGDWLRILPRTLRMAWATDEGTTRAMAAALWAGSDAVVSHISAARLWGLLDPLGAPVHVTTRRHLRRPASWIVLHRAPLERSMQRIRHGVPVTSPARTLFDLASDSSVDLESLLEDAARRGLVTRRELLSLEHALPSQGKSGAARFRKILSRQKDEAFRSRSALEQWALRTFANARLPRPRVQYPIQTPSGVVAVVDFAWPESRVLVEADGYRFHSGRSAWENDLDRHNALVSAGWRPLRLTWQALRHHQPRTLALLRGLLRSSAQSGR